MSMNNLRSKKSSLRRQTTHNRPKSEPPGPIQEITIGDLPYFPSRRPESNKSDYGRILVIAGSYGMAGAAVLTCRAAYRAGAGLVVLAAVQKIYEPLAASLTETVIHPLEGDRPTAGPKNLSSVLELAERCDGGAIGPGLGLNQDTIAFVKGILRRLQKPLVVDADALNAIARRPEIMRRRKSVDTLIFTPHEGELSRLIRVPSSEIRKDRMQFAVAAARRFGVIMVLKGHGTIVTDGAKVFVNPTGNPGMATGGAGDVLTGVIVALLGQGLTPFDAARLGVYVHGRAGDMAAQEKGQTSVIASDIVEALPRAIRERSL